MPIDLVLRVVGPRAADIHRTRNMAEQLHLELLRSGYATTSDPDSMTDELHIHVKHKRDFGFAKKLIRSVVAEHLMDEDVEIDGL